MKIWSNLEEAANLKRRFSGVNRSAFARAFALKGGQAMIYQHINGLRPISLDAAKVYAEGFGCSLEEISPRLAAEVTQAATYASLAQADAVGRDNQPWPFHVPYSRYIKLSRSQRTKLDSVVSAFIDACLDGKR